MAGLSGAPRTRYASCGDTDIAYQVFGDGPVDLLVLPGPLVPIDCVDMEPSMYRFHRRLASFCRVVRFDQRGIGLSSRVASLDVIGPKSWAQDALAVLDAVGCERATIFAPGFTSLAGLVLAADYPQRVSSLVMVNGAARTLRAPDYPIGAALSSADPFTTVGIEPDAVEQGFDVLRIIAPSIADDHAFRSWWDMAGNRAASPSMARAFITKIREADVRDTLERIAVPTLILHRDNPGFSPVAHAHYLAEHIAGSHFVELSGEDALYWVGDTGPMLDEIEEFITGVRGGSEAERLLTTIVFTDIVGSTERAATLGDDRWRDLLDNHDTIVRHELQRFGGREVNTAGDGFVATFSSPSAALACADAIVDAVRVLSIEVRVGIHAGEVEVRGADIAGMAVHIAARVAALAGTSEVLVSSTLRDIVTGSRHRFADRGESPLKGVPGRWRLHALVREHAAVRR
ncbi:alpha/beta hydrolase fold family hydrolase [Mycobacterium haemophilum DSM 44634]|uniref:adenylate/guanylate cyclase domain-containing protein n=1 Tax=Mycobacterium haemophilum TaxID=29311 RepID=UPI000655D3BD|nr:adenylate/guanylate cyclase domain-containing protein [Mycobacterium haemophilum]AKN15598.1 cyclase [Mycobacterium haemophilum DSM 44634]MCV7342529.1 adenylate/guanylate cyclase domain-containing protein [Mycobacterium haemophilum DSM 44634]